MPVNLQLEEDRVVACLIGEIDHHLAKELRETIDGACQRMNPSLLILDFGGVTFMDSSGIGVILGRLKELQRTGGSLTILNPSAQMKKILKMAGLGDLIG